MAKYFATSLAIENVVKAPRVIRSWKNLHPADGGHGRRPSEQFRLEQRVDQIDEQTGGHERSERIVKDHDPISSELFAGVDIRDRQGEEADPECHHHDVHHRNAPNQIRESANRCLLARRFFDLHQIGTKGPTGSLTISALVRIGIREGTVRSGYRNSIKVGLEVQTLNVNEQSERENYMRRTSLRFRATEVRRRLPMQSKAIGRDRFSNELF